jgi:hypothetical protein
MKKMFLEVMRTKKPIVYTGTFFKEDDYFEVRIYPTGSGVSVFAKDVSEHKKCKPH